MRLVLHAGLEETGASYLQAAVKKLTPQLRRRGVTVATHKALGTASSATPTVLISSPALVGPPFQPEPEANLGPVIETLAPSQVTVVLHVRRQDRLMEALYLAEVSRGSDLTFKQAFPDATRSVLDYSELVERIAAVPGVSEVRVRPFELSGAGGLAYLADFLATAGLGTGFDLSVVGAGAVDAGSLSRKGMHVARAMNTHLDTDDERKLVRRFVREQFPIREERDTRVMPKALRPEVLEAYRPLNEAFFAKYLPDLPAGSYSDEEGTAALGTVLTPVTVAARPARSPVVEKTKAWARRRLPAPLRLKLAAALRRVAPRRS